MAQIKEELKSHLKRVKEESEKAGLKLNSKKTKIVAFSPITLWPIEGGKVEAVTDSLSLSSKITANGDCSHGIRRHLLLGKKARRCVKKQNITFPAVLHVVKVMVFPVIMYGYESWTIKKAENQRIDAFKLWR